MRYEVRYQIGGDERIIEVEADDAATAARLAQEAAQHNDDVFELIQIHLLDQPEEIHHGLPPVDH